MPRPKGSKNKKSLVVVETVENIDEKIATAESAIAALTEELKTKKAELKELTKAKAEAEKLAAEKKEEKKGGGGGREKGGRREKILKRKEGGN